jgi:hypothetical protein
MIGGRDNRTPHNELGPYDEHRELARPAAEVAAAIGAVFTDQHDRVVEAAMSGKGTTEVMDEVLALCAAAAIEVLRKRGMFNLDAIAAIKEEKGK